MKVLKTSKRPPGYGRGPEELKEYTLDYRDEKELANVFFISNNDHMLGSLIKYLKDTNTDVLVDEEYDLQSGWTGNHLIIDGEDLSRNGFAYRVDYLKDFLIKKGYYTKPKKQAFNVLKFLFFIE